MRGIKVTFEIRDAHYKAFGNMVDDIEIWNWYQNQQEIERRREAHRNSTKKRIR